jgi:hypothetical protein
MPSDVQPMTAAEMGRKGGLTTAKNRTKEERQKMARKAARARWRKAKQK